MLEFTLTPRSLDSGAPEEHATFGTFQIHANGRCLTEGVAHGGYDGNDLLSGPCVSGYHVAEWLAWNRWRLRWEARPNDLSRDWVFAHRLSSIGEGYVWPNIEIASDGVRAIIISAPAIDPQAGLYRYVGAPTCEVVDATDLEAAIDGFADHVLGLLNDAGVDTNLHRLWHDIEHERQDGESAQRRRLEARLGHDPDEASSEDIRRAIDAARDLGIDSVEELAADVGWRGTTTLPTAKELAATAASNGLAMHPQDAVKLHAKDHLPAWGEVAAWRLGVATAHMLRQQEVSAGEPLGNERLAELAGAPAAILNDGDNTPPSPLSFMLATDGHVRAALRSKWETGRRFDLARLLGDRLIGEDEPLRPATRAYTYRQKAQRAFAAELLCPYEAVRDFLCGDRSEERCDEAAHYFNVSPVAISSLLRNNESHSFASADATSAPHTSVIW